MNLLRTRFWGRPNNTQKRDLDTTFEVLVERNYRYVYAFLYRALNNEADAADLTQETFIRVYRALPRLRQEGASTAWIRRIAANVCVDFVRRRRRMSWPETVSQEGWRDHLNNTTLCDQVVDPAALAEERERDRTLHGAIDGLPTTYRTVIVLHHLVGMRVADIAEALGVPVGTVKSRLSRARTALYRTLKPLLTSE